MNRMTLKTWMLGGGMLMAIVVGCAKDEAPEQMKRERDRLSYQVTDLQSQLDKANAEIARLKAAQK